MSGECPVQQRDGLIQSQGMLSLPQPHWVEGEGKEQRCWTRGENISGGRGGVTPPTSSFLPNGKVIYGPGEV